MKIVFEYEEKFIMKEIRKDSITGDLVIYASYRNQRPHDMDNASEDFNGNGEEYNSECPFCRGNESKNDELKDSIELDGDWVSKSVANKFPIIDMSTEEIFGKHEVLVETFRHNGSFYNMNIEEFQFFFTLLIRRVDKLEKEKGIKYVNVFKNFLRNSGASLMHPHSQITSFNLIPPEIQKELQVAREHYKNNKSSLYDDIISAELKYQKRVVYNGEYFLVYVPYATRYNGEIRIIQKDDTEFGKLGISHIKEISYILKELFKNWKAYQGEIPFNMLIHTYPVDNKEKDVFRTHFHIVPRKYNFGGFELSTNLFVCGTDPNQLAEFLKFQ